MATTTEDLHRIIPIQGGEIARRRLEDHGGSGANQMQAGEYHSSIDAAGFTRHFIAHQHVGGYLYHGDVATEAAMLALDNPGVAHACLRGDKCRRTDLGAVMLCISGRGTLATDWLSLGSGGSGGGGAWGSITGTLADQTDLAAALTSKAPASHTHAQTDITGLVSALAGKSKTLIAGSGVALVDTPDGMVISLALNGAGSALIVGISSDSFEGIALGEISTVATGFGWLGDGVEIFGDNLSSSDGFDGIPAGDITSVTTGTGWTGVGVEITTP